MAPHAIIGMRHAPSRLLLYKIFFLNVFNLKSPRSVKPLACGELTKLSRN
jgi:hypothetical protein